MRVILDAACGSNAGKLRQNNEDNYYFGGKHLPLINRGTHHPVIYRTEISDSCSMAVFDGMGGEDFGEIASYAASSEMTQIMLNQSSEYISGKVYLNSLTRKLNQAVCEAAKAQCTSRMGCTFACLYFEGRNVYCCNVGDSRIYRLRAGVFTQISKDHIENTAGAGESNHKSPLTQYIGIDPEELMLEPYIRYDELKDGDRFIICSDGLTDMLSNIEINSILCLQQDCDRCVDALIQAALDKGGKDNVTVIVCTAHIDNY